MVFVADGIVPARFLLLIAHLTITIVLFWSKDENLLACLPLEYSSEDYTQKEKQLTIGLSLALGLISFEMLGFLFGVTMFMPSVALISISCHSAACVLLAYFVFDEWDCNLYWWIFGTCIAFPALTEMIVIIVFISFKRNLY